MQTRFESWLRDKCSNLKCALCQSVRWKIGDLLLPVHVNPADEPGAEEPVMAQLVCKNCATWCCSMSVGSKAGMKKPSPILPKR